MKIVIVGNVIDGLDFIGPFQDFDLALEYAQQQYRNTTWHIADVSPPQGELGGKHFAVMGRLEDDRADTCFCCMAKDEAEARDLFIESMEPRADARAETYIINTVLRSESPMEVLS